MLKILDSKNTPIEIPYSNASLIIVENLQTFMSNEHLRKVDESEITFRKINNAFQFNLNGQVFVTNDFYEIADTINDMSVDSIQAEILENRNDITIVISYHNNKHWTKTIKPFEPMSLQFWIKFVSKI